MIRDLVSWYKEDKYQIWWTVAGAVLSTLLALICENVSFFKSIFTGKLDEFIFRLTPQVEYGIQSFFIIIAIFVILTNMWSTTKDLKNKSHIIGYMIDNCNVKVFCREDNDRRYNVVRKTTLIFYYLWLVVWVLWLCYYLGNFLFSVAFPNAHNSNVVLARTIFSQIFDFLSSTAFLGIYLILTDITVDRKRRGGEATGLWTGGIVMIMLTVLFIVGLIHESIYINLPSDSNDTTLPPNIVSISLSIFSAGTFVLMLGKINSNYMRIPNAFLMIMYLYAIIQCYIPFKGSNELPLQIFNVALPYVTLMGKVFVLLSLCWITYKKRLIFFVIHRSTAIDNIPRMLSELNQDLAEY